MINYVNFSEKNLFITINLIIIKIIVLKLFVCYSLPTNEKKSFIAPHSGKTWKLAIKRLDKFSKIR